jgi:hypothetical protein
MAVMHRPAPRGAGALAAEGRHGPHAYATAPGSALMFGCPGAQIKKRACFTSLSAGS